MQFSIPILRFPFPMDAPLTPMSIAPGDQQVGWHPAVPQRFPVGLLHCSHRHKAPHHRIGSMCVFCPRIPYLSCKVWYGPKNEGIKWKKCFSCARFIQKKAWKNKPLHTNVDHISSLFNLNMCAHKKAPTCNNLVIQKKSSKHQCTDSQCVILEGEFKESARPIHIFPWLAQLSRSIVSC